MPRASRPIRRASMLVLGSQSVWVESAERQSRTCHGKREFLISLEISHISHHSVTTTFIVMNMIFKSRKNEWSEIY